MLPRKSGLGRPSKNFGGVFLVVLFLSLFAGRVAAQPGCWPPVHELEKQLQPQIQWLTGQLKETPLNASLYRGRAGLNRRLGDCAGAGTTLGLAYYHKAVEDLSTAIALEPSAENYLLRAHAYRQMAYSQRMPQWDQSATVDFFLRFSFFSWAVADLQEAVRLSATDEQRLESLSGLGGLHSWRAQTLATPAAIAELRLRGNPYSVWQDFDTAIAYAQQWRKHAVKDDCARPGCREEQKRLVAWQVGGTYLAKAGAALELEELDRALAAFQSGEEYLTDDADLFCRYYALWGDTQFKKSLLPQAIATITKALEASEISAWNCSSLLERRADALLALDDQKAALADYTLLLEKIETNQRCCTGRVSIKRARLLIKLGEPGKAVADIDFALANWRVPECPQVYRLRAEAHRLLGNRAQARADEQKAASLKSPANCAEYN